MSVFWLKMNRERMTKKYRKVTNKQKNQNQTKNTRIGPGLGLIFNFKYFEKADGSLTLFFSTNIFNNWFFLYLL